jgi:hypothetical protein
VQDDPHASAIVSGCAGQIELALFGRCAKQQSRRRYAANGFAFVPQTLPCPRTSHGIGRVVELANRQPDEEA